MAVPLTNLSTQVDVTVLHHLPDAQSASFAQPLTTDTPQRLFVALHAPDRQTVAALAAAHGPAPSAYPQRLSLSQTPAAHTAAPTPAAHVPSSAGVCPATVGIAVPLVSFSEHVDVAVLHHLPDAQSASFAQPLAAGTHTSELAPHAPERHTVAAFAAVQGPVPSLYPQAWSLMSQTADAHTAVPTSAVHRAVSGGVCPATEGIAVPLMSLSTQVDVTVLHHLPDAQSVSAVQPATTGETPQMPVGEMQSAERQTWAPLALVHGPSPFA